MYLCLPSRLLDLSILQPGQRISSTSTRPASSRQREDVNHWKTDSYCHYLSPDTGLSRRLLPLLDRQLQSITYGSHRFDLNLILLIFNIISQPFWCLMAVCYQYINITIIIVITKSGCLADLLESQTGWALIFLNVPSDRFRKSRFFCGNITCGLAWLIWSMTWPLTTKMSL